MIGISRARRGSDRGKVIVRGSQKAPALLIGTSTVGPPMVRVITSERRSNVDALKLTGPKKNKPLKIEGLKGRTVSLSDRDHVAERSLRCGASMTHLLVIERDEWVVTEGRLIWLVIARHHC